MGAPQSPREGFDPPSLPRSPLTSPARVTELPLVLFVVGPDLVKVSLGERAAALIAFQALFGNQVEFDEAGGAVIDSGMQLLALHEVDSFRWKGMSPRGARLALARLAWAVVLEEGEAGMPVVRQLVGVESPIR